jgi:hypothetical protein
MENKLKHYHTEMWEANIKYSNLTLKLYMTGNKIMSLFQH